MSPPGSWDLFWLVFLGNVSVLILSLILSLIFYPVSRRWSSSLSFGEVSERGGFYLCFL